MRWIRGGVLLVLGLSTGGWVHYKECPPGLVCSVNSVQLSSRTSTSPWVYSDQCPNGSGVCRIEEFMQGPPKSPDTSACTEANLLTAARAVAEYLTLESDLLITHSVYLSRADDLRRQADALDARTARIQHLRAGLKACEGRAVAQE